MSRVTGNKTVLSWISRQPQAPPWENSHLQDHFLNLWHCHAPDNFPALDLENLHHTLKEPHLLHHHNLFRSLHHGIRVRNVHPESSPGEPPQQRLAILFMSCICGTSTVFFASSTSSSLLLSAT